MFPKAMHIWLISACPYNTWQQENMRLTGSMRLIKSAVGGACVKDVSRVERPTTVAKKQPESVILDVFFFLGSCNRSLVVTRLGGLLGIIMRLTKSGKARTKLCA